MYWLLGRPSPKFPCRWIDDEPYVEGVNFRTGRAISVPVPRPLRFSLEPLDPGARDSGPAMPPVFKENFLLFRDDLVKAMQSFGVDNLDLYETAIFDPDSDQVHTNYKAVNIVGLIAAADFAKSKATVYDSIPLIDVDFDSLVIDETRTRNSLIFRLAEKTAAIMVRGDLKEYLEKNGFPDITFDDPRTSAV